MNKRKPVHIHLFSDGLSGLIHDWAGFFWPEIIYTREKNTKNNIKWNQNCYIVDLKFDSMALLMSYSGILLIFCLFIWCLVSIYFFFYFGCPWHMGQIKSRVCIQINHHRQTGERWMFQFCSVCTSFNAQIMFIEISIFYRIMANSHKLLLHS